MMGATAMRVRIRETHLLVVMLGTLGSDELCFNVALVLFHAVPIFRIFCYLHDEHAVEPASGVESIKLQVCIRVLGSTTLGKHSQPDTPHINS